MTRQAESAEATKAAAAGFTALLRIPSWVWATAAGAALLFLLLSCWTAGLFGRKSRDSDVRRKPVAANPKSQTPDVLKTVTGPPSLPPPKPAPATDSRLMGLGKPDIRPPVLSPSVTDQGAGEVIWPESTRPPEPQPKVSASPDLPQPGRNSLELGGDTTAEAPVATALPPALGGKATPLDLVKHAQKLLTGMRFNSKFRGKDAIRDRAVQELNTVARGITRDDPAVHIDRIRDQLRQLEDVTENPANREKLEEASRCLELAVAKINGSSPSVPSRKAHRPEPPSSRAVSLGSPNPIAGSWRMTAPAREFTLIAKDRRRPPGSFWPELSPEHSKEWTVGDPSAIKLEAKGVILEQGERGNFLLTGDEYRSCALSVTLAVSENTEAYLVLRARREPDRWRGITSRIIGSGGKVALGRLATDFQANEQGRLSGDKLVDRTFMMKLTIDEREMCRVLLGAEETASVNLASQPTHNNVGVAGIFVRRGSVLLESVSVHKK